ncbi:MAG: hypothetical protein Q3X77_08960 [Oscillospiraceae bacterium]|nr:hypothetical protein [Oscillospiraceae bacterium]
MEKLHFVIFSGRSALPQLREAAAAHAAKKGVSHAEVFEKFVHSPALPQSDVLSALRGCDAAEQFA